MFLTDSLLRHHANSTENSPLTRTKLLQDNQFPRMDAFHSHRQPAQHLQWL